MKIVVIMVGCGAAGKTTTTQTFAEGVPHEYMETRIVSTRAGDRPMSVVWTVYDNCAVAGSHHSGTDANNSVSCATEAMMECAKVRDIIIIDGYMSSPRWVHTANAIINDDVGGIVAVYFNLSPQETVTRLARRRGVSVESIWDKMYPKHKGLVSRVTGMLNHIRKLATVKYEIVTITALMSPNEIVYAIDDAIETIYTYHGLSYYDD